MMNSNKLDKKNILEIIKNEWRAAFTALHFLTIIPPYRQKSVNAKELGKSVAYFPLIGCLIGLSLFGFDRIVSIIFPTSVGGALLIAFWVALSGGLHVDGFLDSCDGILGGANPDDRLRIMKDERVGAFALIGGILLIVIKFAALNSLINLRVQALLLAPIISRWGMSLAIVCFPYGRSTGIGKDIKSFAGRREAFIATILAILGAWIIADFSGLLIAVISLPFIWGISRFILSRIPGLTGDSYGAINESIEVLVLLTFTAITNLS